VIVSLLLGAAPGFVALQFPQVVPYILIAGVATFLTGGYLLYQDNEQNKTERKIAEDLSDVRIRLAQIRLDLARTIQATPLDKLREMNKRRLSLVTSLTSNGPEPEYEYTDSYHIKFRLPKDFVIYYLQLATKEFLPITGNRDDEGFSDKVRYDRDDPNSPTLRRLAEDTKRVLKALQLAGDDGGPNRCRVYSWDDVCEALGLTMEEIEK
jgi:hypothetical protein